MQYSAQANAVNFAQLRQSICNDAIASALVAEEAASGRGDHHVLFSILPLKRHGGGVSAGVDFRHPQLLAGFRIKGAEAAVVGGADKYEAAGGGERSADVGPSGVL